MINESRDAPVGVEGDVLIAFLLLLPEVEVLGLIGESEFLKDEGDFPD